MSKWYEIAYSIHRRAYVEVNNDEGPQEAMEVALEEEISGDDVDVIDTSQLDEESVRQHGAGTGRIFELHHSDRRD